MACQRRHAAAGASASTRAFEDADEKMTKGMSVPAYTGDADKGFVIRAAREQDGGRLISIWQNRAAVAYRRIQPE
jgi:hypothetical protein